MNRNLILFISLIAAVGIFLLLFVPPPPPPPSKLPVTSVDTTSDPQAEPKPDNEPQDQTNEFAALFFQGEEFKEEYIQERMTLESCKLWQKLQLGQKASTKAKTLQFHIKKCNCEELFK